MKKTVCILAAMLAAVLTGTVSADENLASFVSKDKVWHYNKCTHHHMPDERLDVEEGHLLMFTPDDTLINHTAYSVLAHLSPDSNAVGTLAFMREEDGRLFVILNHPIFEQMGREVPPGTEIMAFDFNAEAGHSYQGIVIGDIMERGNVFVNSVGSTTVDGTVFRTQRLWHSPNAGSGKLVIEGIGCDGPSWFYIPEIGTYMAGLTNVDVRFYLDHVADAEGNVIFGKEDFDRASVGSIQNDLCDDRRKYDLNGREIRNPEPGTVYIQGGRKMSGVRH